MWSVPSVSLISTPSVISTSRREGSRPAAPSASSTASQRPCWRNCTGETFTATEMPSGQLAALRQASASTQLPIGPMRPVSSAMPMKTSGGTSPWPGRFHRSSASRQRQSFGAVAERRVFVPLRADF
jgi:hypothetical protein